MPEEKEHHKRHSRKRVQQKPGIFDISKPHRITPSASGRPIIVGHHPTMPDPMVRHDEAKLPKPSNEKTVPVKDEDAAAGVTPVAVTSVSTEEPKTEVPSPAEHQPETPEAPLPTETPAPPQEEIKPPEPQSEAAPVLEEVPAAPTPTLPPEAEPASPAPLTSGTEQQAADIPKPAQPAKPDRHDLIGTKPLPIPKGAGPYSRTRRLTLWSLSAVLLLLLFYVLLDAKVIPNSLNLPIHLFKR